jgi:hypothetical protein
LSMVSLRSSSRPPWLFQLHQYVVNVGFDVSTNLRFQDDTNALLICGSPNFHPEGHLCVTEDHERCFFLVINGEADLIIAQIGV